MAGSGFRFRSGSRNMPTSFAGKLGISVFFSFFFLLGAVITSVFGYMIVSDLLVYTWEPTPAVVQSIEIEEDRDKNQPYRIAVVFEYEVAGQTYTSDRFDRNDSRSDDRAEVGQLADRYAAGSETMCYVHPDDPSEAVLRRPPLGERAIMAAFMVIPLVFMLVGLGGIYAVWRTPTQEEDSAVSIGTTPGREGRGGRIAVAIFFAIFFLFGSIFPTIFFIVPAWRMAQAQDWHPVECTITDSRVRSHSDSDGTTYSIDIEYEYTYNDRTYRSNRYAFTGGSSSGRSGKQAVVDAHPPGSTTTAYVDPKNPHEAVISREFGSSLWIGLITFIFPLVGLGGLIGVAISARRAAAADAGDAAVSSAGPYRPAAGARSDRPLGDVAETGPVTLEAKDPRWVGFVFLLLFALAWNGFVYALMVSEMGITWFSLIFMAVGALVVLGVIHQGLRLLNPKVIMQVHSSRIRLGDRVGVNWRLSGNASRIRKLTVTLKGQEEAEYTSGTNRVTDRQTFAEYVLAEREHNYDITQGEVDASIPLHAMHTFKGDHNRVIWLLHVHGDIPFWPDLDQSFEVTILPRELAHA